MVAFSISLDYRATWRLRNVENQIEKKMNFRRQFHGFGEHSRIIASLANGFG
jgi:hypothetical protein